MRCTNCGGPHGARADACTTKKTTHQLARGWRTPSPPRQEWGTKAPEFPEDETPVAQGGEEAGGVEVEEGFEAASEEMGE